MITEHTYLVLLCLSFNLKLVFNTLFITNKPTCLLKPLYLAHLGLPGSHHHFPLNPIIFFPCVNRKVRWATGRALSYSRYWAFRTLPAWGQVGRIGVQLISTARESSFCRLSSWPLFRSLSLDFNILTYASRSVLCLTSISNLWHDTVYTKLWFLTSRSFICWFSLTARINCVHTLLSLIYADMPSIYFWPQYCHPVLPRAWLLEWQVPVSLNFWTFVLFQQHPANFLALCLIYLCLLNT